ncbi:DUF58 domain-containing protein [Microbacterium karelineae]|uniref:DUF58 domain-containing protein n=1 Tax=Microbacterium karelineae TaxID=2654283 RepID=UPI001E515009|nr:DUF58 domain-containing protein [Microbacterium karelineae]
MTTPQTEVATWREVALYLVERVGAAGRRAAAVVRPVGWILTASAVVLWILGAAMGWWEVIVAAAVITATIGVCLLFLIGRTAYDVTLDLTRTRVVVGERAVGAFTVANPGERALLPSRVVLPVGSARGTFSVGRLAPGEQNEELFAIPTTRRTILSVGPVSIVRGDPLGLFERNTSRDEPVDLFVHPKTVGFAGESLGFVRDLEGMVSRDLTRDDIAFHALSEYQPGDDLRHVHWRSTARTGTLMVRTYEQTRRSHFVIGLSTNRAEYGDEDEFELGVSIAGSLGLRALRDASHVDVMIPQRTLNARTPRILLDSLSGIGQTAPRSGGTAELSAQVGQAAPAASVVVLVSGRRVDPANLRGALSRLPLGARVLAIVASSGEETARRRVGDADVLTIGSLDAVPSAIGRVLT